MMMLGGNKKKLASVIIGNMSKNGAQNKEVDMSVPELDADAGYHAAMGEFISAVHSKDEKAAHKALLNHYKMCSVADDYQAQDTAGNEANRQNFND